MYYLVRFFIRFLAQTKPHDRFERDGDDLIYYCDCTLAEALSGLSKSVKTLDNRILPIQMGYVTPDTVKVISGEGFFNRKKRTNGNLVIKFKVKFPTALENNAIKRKKIVDILSSN